MDFLRKVVCEEKFIQKMLQVDKSRFGLGD